MQTEHIEASFIELYVPASQNMHVGKGLVVSKLYDPSAQVAHMEPESNDLVAQDKHAENPVPVLYVPGAQAEHTEAVWTELYVPLLHHKHVWGVAAVSVT